MDAIRVRQATGQRLMQATMFLVLGTETAFFATLVMTYLFMRGGGVTLAFARPGPVDVGIAALNSLVLITSAAVAWQAQGAIAGGRSGSLKRGLLVAFLLGLVFVAGQIFEFRHSGLSLRDFTFGGI